MAHERLPDFIILGATNDYFEPRNPALFDLIRRRTDKLAPSGTAKT
jgi:hypothetical protein